MADFFLKLNGTIDRRSPQDEGEPTEPVLRENWLARDGKLAKPAGTERAITTTLTGIPRWGARYYTPETGAVSPRSYVYTEDGALWILNDVAKTATAIKQNLNINAYPKHWIFKTSNQAKMYLVDGKNLFSFDGNNDNLFNTVLLTDTNGNSIEPVDVIEHLDRLWLISKTMLFVSKNLDPEIFNDATDSLAIIVGSGKGKNLALGKIEDKLFILTTEGIYVVSGDTISALASTFEIRLVDERKILAGRSLTRVENALLFVADDGELWSFNGSDSELLTYKFKLKGSLNMSRNMLDKMVATYYNKYYMLSFVETGQVEPNLELWYDTFENKIDIVRGRNVSCYLKTDSAEETEYLQTGRSDIGMIMDTERGYNFDGSAIVTRLRSRGIGFAKGENARITAFYPHIEPTGNRALSITYLLDGRSSNPSGVDASFNQNLRGETKGLGAIQIGNQAQFTDRVRPKINYATGESIAFSIIDATLDLRADFLGIGIDFIKKHKKKGKAVGQ